MDNPRLIKVEQSHQDSTDIFNDIIVQGPGEGINRAELRFESPESQKEFGVLTTVVESNAASEAALIEFGQAYLAQYSKSSKSMKILSRKPIEIVTNGFKTGDTILLSDPKNNILKESKRAVEMEITEKGFTAFFEERRKTLNDPLDEYKLEQRRALDKPLPPPVTPSATPSPNGGCDVSVTPWAQRTARGIEVYASKVPDFVPSRESLKARLESNLAPLPSLEAGYIWNFRVRTYGGEQSSHFSDFSEQFQAYSSYGRPRLLNSGLASTVITTASGVTTGSNTVVAIPDFNTAVRKNEKLLLELSVKGTSTTNDAIIKSYNLTATGFTNWERTLAETLVELELNAEIDLYYPTPATGSTTTLDLFYKVWSVDAVENRNI